MMPCNDAGGYRGYGYKFGNSFHIGHDFNQPEKTKIKACNKGVVIFSDEVNGFGGIVKNGIRTAGGVVIIKHINKFGGEYLALYSHLKRYLIKDEEVSEGDEVGELIPYYMANGQRADHLHFVISVLKQFIPQPWGYRESLIGTVNPINYLKKYC